jgi:uncharacterized protein YecE (DUF72 family)
MPRTAQRRIYIGTAGWSIPRASAHYFPDCGTHLQKYVSIMSATEINSSFHRPHRAETYKKWAASTPREFRFAVKFPQTITHDQVLRRVQDPLARFLDESSGLGAKRGPLLLQFPPSFTFERRIVKRFLDALRARYEGPAVCEPRHETWFARAASELLTSYRVARVAADPSIVSGAGEPGGWGKIVYLRLHGSPRKYWSRYPQDYVEALARKLTEFSQSADVWCIFDNTASGAAIENALELYRELHKYDEGKSNIEAAYRFG